MKVFNTVLALLIWQAGADSVRRRGNNDSGEASLHEDESVLWSRFLAADVALSVPTVAPTLAPVTSTPAPDPSGSAAPTPSPVESTPAPTPVPDGAPTPAPAPPSPTVEPTLAPTDIPTVSPTVPFEIQNEKVTCISVIDESNGQSNGFVAKWQNLRQEFEERPFCLLQPQRNGSPGKGALDIPDAFEADELTQYDNVTRDAEDRTDPSDWYNKCDLQQQRDMGITRVGKLVCQ